MTALALGRYSTHKRWIAGVGALRWRAIGRHDSRDAPKVKARELWSNTHVVTVAAEYKSKVVAACSTLNMIC